uniref:EGF-like domain-containing protein n=1 Tax=Plectus sambesii TaxID=2011161 RepID=A0A914VT30_9BILA
MKVTEASNARSTAASSEAPVALSTVSQEGKTTWPPGGASTAASEATRTTHADGFTAANQEKTTPAKFTITIAVETSITTDTTKYTSEHTSSDSSSDPISTQVTLSLITTSDSTPTQWSSTTSDSVSTAAFNATAAITTAATTSAPIKDGYCLNGGETTCTCPPGFTGRKCESFINWCNVTEVVEDGAMTRVDLCGLHGSCAFQPSNGSYCDCFHGWTGKFCETPIPDQVLISKRCHFYFGATQPNPDCDNGSRCLPDDLDCGFVPCQSPGNIGWCVPIPTHEAIFASFRAVHPKFVFTSRH